MNDKIILLLLATATIVASSCSSGKQELFNRKNLDGRDEFIGKPLYNKDANMESLYLFSVVKDAGAAIFGSRGGNGVIMITTKQGDGGSSSSRHLLNVKTLSPLGYQVSKEFYSPKYKTRQQKESTAPDMRTTVYWNPNVKVKLGEHAKLGFYTSDASSEYSVVIEGLTANGLLIHAVKKISRMDD